MPKIGPYFTFTARDPSRFVKYDFSEMNQYELGIFRDEIKVGEEGAWVGELGQGVKLYLVKSVLQPTNFSFGKIGFDSQ